MRRWWALPAAMVVVGVALVFVDVHWGVLLLIIALPVGIAVAAATPAPGAVPLRPTIDHDGITWLDRGGNAVASARWEDVERVRAWTRVLWMGNGVARYQHHLDVVTRSDDQPRRTRHRKRSDPSLDEVIALVRRSGVPVEDHRRFGMIESVRGGR